MKIGRRDDGQDAVTITRRTEADPSNANRAEAREKPGVRHAYGHGDTDKVHFGLRDTIDAALRANDDDVARKARVQELKKLVQSGQYNPPTQDVARKLGEEITFEILLKPGDTGEE